MSTCASRSGLIVNEDIPKSNFPVFIPSTSVPSGAFGSSTFSPSTAPIAFARSASNPITVVPSVSVSSLGARSGSAASV
jgi:hypothetical protein